MPRSDRDQVMRASASVALNIAEGAGRRLRGEKRQFYGIARGSACEVSAILDMLLVSEVVDLEEHDRAHRILVQIVKLVTRMILNSG